MQQKVIQIGNSIGVVIPQVLNNGELQPGDSVVVEKKEQKFIFAPVKKSKQITGGVDAKFAKMVDEFIDEHKDVLAELAHR